MLNLILWNKIYIKIRYFITNLTHLLNKTTCYLLMTFFKSQGIKFYILVSIKLQLIIFSWGGGIFRIFSKFHSPSHLLIYIVAASFLFFIYFLHIITCNKRSKHEHINMHLQMCVHKYEHFIFAWAISCQVIPHLNNFYVLKICCHFIHRQSNLKLLQIKNIKFSFCSAYGLQAFEIPP